MKTIRRLSVVFALIVATTISSCAGSDDEPRPPISTIPATGSYINATSDGAAFSTVIMGQSAATASRVGTGSSAIVTILGTNVSLTDTSGSKSISIVLQGVTGAGTYTMNSTSGSILSYIVNGTQAAQVYKTVGCTGVSGTITITTLTATKIEGTFSFTGKNELCTVTKSVTAGTFRGIFN